jgi:ketosteroid isomerase-like protein
MASANLDLVRSIYAAWGRGDFFGVEEWADPKTIEFVIADGPSPGRWTGLTSEEAARDFLSPWEELRMEAEEYRALDDERVLVFAHGSGRGKTSGVELGQMRPKVATLFHVRDGKVTRLVVYWDRERALADLGLASEAGSSPS